MDAPIEELAGYYGIKEDEDKEAFISSISNLTQLTSRVPDSNMFETWSKVVYDDNPIHTSEKAARDFELAKLETTPTYGTMILAYGEQYIKGVLSKIKSKSSQENYINAQRVKFTGPLYPGERLSWGINSVGRKDDGNGIELSIKGNTESGREIATIACSLGIKRKALEPGELERFLGAGEGLDFEISKESVSDFYRCIGVQNQGEVADSHASALGVAALLKVFHEKTKSYEGINRRMDFDFYAGPLIGTYKIYLQPPSVRGNEKGFLAQTEVLGVHGESDTVVYSGKITTGSLISPV